MVLVSAASGCAAGYQPYATTTLATPVVQAEVTAPAPVIDAQVQLAPVQQPVVVQQPELVTITPDVQVVAAYDADPVFYTGGFYWREHDGGWYRSHSHDTGWTSYRDVPYSVRSIENRGSYRNYRPAGYQPRASYSDNRYQRPSYDRGYQPRPSGGYGRPAGGYNQPTGYNRPQAQRPAYGNSGYQRPAGYQPRPSRPAGYNSTGYSNPRPSGYNQGSPGYQPRPSRPSTGYTSGRPSSGYTQGSPGYQPRPSSGYGSGRPAGYQPRPSQSYASGRPAYQPRPSSSSSYNRPSSSKRQPASSSRRR